MESADGLISSEVFAQGNGFNNNDISGLSSQLVALENFNPNFSLDPFNWIPRGLMRNLMDDRNDAFFGIVNLNVQVLGYTTQQLINALQFDVNSPQQYRDRLLQKSGNNQGAQVTNLFQLYGYN